MLPSATYCYLVLTGAAQVLVYPCRIYDHGQHTGQLRPPRPDQMVPGANWGMFNDLGVYGVPRRVTSANYSNN